MCLLLGASGVGKTLLVKRLQKLSSRDARGDVGAPPPTQPTVGTNLTDIVVQRRITIRELGGCMGPIWSSYYGNCRCLLRPALLHDHGGDQLADEASGHHRPRQAEYLHSRSQRAERHWPGTGAALAPGHPRSQQLMAGLGVAPGTGKLRQQDRLLTSGLSVTETAPGAGRGTRPVPVLAAPSDALARPPTRHQAV